MAPKGYRYYAGQNSSFLYSFPRYLVKTELDLLKHEMGIQKLPLFIENLIGKLVSKMEESLEQAFAQSVQRALQTGGISAGIVSRGNLRYGIGGAAFKAGPRLFRPSSAVTGAFQAEITFRSSSLSVPTQFKLQLHPGTVSAAETVPKGYRAPRDESDTIPFPSWPLEPFWRKKMPTNAVNIAAQIEYGNRYTRPLVVPFQGLDGNSYSNGFHPFEGAIKHNLDDIQKLYAKGLKQIMRTEAFISYKGQRLNLPTFLKKLAADQVTEALEQELRVRQKNPKLIPFDPNRTIKKSEDRTMFNQLKKILPASHPAMKWMDAEMIQKVQSMKKTPRNSVFGLALDPSMFARADIHLIGGIE